MPDTRRHRGPHPADPELFAPQAYPALQSAVADLAWLSGRGYASESSLKLVGDRYALTARQRIAVSRGTCNDAQLASRSARHVAPTTVRDQALWLDGFNVLTTLEVALSGGVILLGRDGCCRDIAGMHGHYRLLDETVPAIQLLAQSLQDLAPRQAVIFLDQPVSNSGRLAQRLRQVLAGHPTPTEVTLVTDPDRDLAQAPSDVIIATADSEVLDAGGRWTNLARYIVEQHLPQAWLVPLGNAELTKHSHA